ncbi:hypothetical protein IQ257_22400 [Coleofasciculus sp. LEGE 07092]|nr:hypothetical protein [Coleofasciculus sp. LEGE 07081]MBE9151189.1 hypothetical protein [Coleofasciculus sp. LEGE 07092]
MTDKIHLITHIHKNLLIVLYTDDQGWLFRVVSSAGEMLQEQAHLESAEAAEQAGQEWIANSFSSPG